MKSTLKEDEQSPHLNKRIVWVTFLVLDAQLHKTSQFEILGNLAKRGYDTALIAIQSKSKFLNKKKQVSVVAIPLRNIPIITSFVYGMLIFLFLPLYIIFLNPDFIITQPTIPITSFISTFPISRIKRIKILMDIRTVPVQTGLRGFLHDFLFTTSILVAKKFFDGITIITSSMKEEICRKYNLNPDLIGVWSSGVSPTLFNPETWIPYGLEIRARLGLVSRFVVFYHGVLSPNRGLVETIEAIKLLRNEHPEVVLFLLGSGPLTPVLKELVEKDKLNSNVIIHDQVDYEDVPKYISMSDVGIIPLPDLHYWRSQSPLKLLEYLAMEKVVINSDIPAHRDIIGEETCGIYIPLINSADIAKSIIYALQNKNKLKNWGKIGRSIIRKGYTWQIIASDLESYMQSLD
jgi:glycosyltransferase involved in cell wall biosynthesis